MRPLLDVDAIHGEKVVLNCEVSGTPEPKITWFKDNQPFKPTFGTTISNKNGECSLVILNASSNNNGEYICKAVNKSGADEVKACVSVKGIKSVLSR